MIVKQVHALTCGRLVVRYEWAVLDVMRDLMGEVTGTASGSTSPDGQRQRAEWLAWRLGPEGWEESASAAPGVAAYEDALRHAALLALASWRDWAAVNLRPEHRA